MKYRPHQYEEFGVGWAWYRIHLSSACIKLILAAIYKIKVGQSLTVKKFKRLLGLMAAESNVIPFGLL